MNGDNYPANGLCVSAKSFIYPINKKFCFIGGLIGFGKECLVLSAQCSVLSAQYQVVCSTTCYHILKQNQNNIDVSALILYDLVNVGVF